MKSMWVMVGLLVSACGHAPSTPTETKEPVAERPAVDGAALFANQCAACHRADGGGIIGPNLADSAWLHGDGLEAIRRTIRDGVAARGMPAWSSLLDDAQLDAVAAYVVTLRTTNPPDPKAPQAAE